jgi:hypothetical protein
MSAPPITSNISTSSSISDLWQGTGQAFGHVWKIIHQLPHQLYQIILTIRDVIARCLGFHSHQDSNATTIPISPAHTVNPAQTSPDETKEEPVEMQDKDAANLEEEADLFSALENTQDPAFSVLAKESPIPLKIKDPTSLILEDPLGSMGAAAPVLNRTIDDLPNEDALKRVRQTKEIELDNEILGEVKQLVQPAQELLKSIANEPPTTLQAYLNLREQLEDNLISLKGDSSTFIEIEEAHALIQEVLVALQEKINILDEKLCSEARNLTQPGLDLLKKIGNNKQRTLQAYLDLRDQLEDALAPLKDCASTFIMVEEAHRLIQTTNVKLERKVQILERELCALVKNQYRPNPRVPTDGHCLFWSIKYHLKSQEGFRYYRKLAADFIRNHPQDFEEGVCDTLKSSQPVRDRINQYVGRQGGKVEWMAKLEKKLGRKPTTIDRYCDCLENSSLWGGVNELLALLGLETGNAGDEGAIQMPILLFTAQKDKTWRIDLVKGTKFKDKKPLLLYYNGINHYQNLISR